MPEIVSDVAYIHTAHPQLSPVFLRAVFASVGQPFPGGQTLRVCEIGCGTGLSAAITAATHPDSSVLAIDASALHAAMAADLGREAGLSNLRVEHADISGFEERGDGFDLILCHGVLAWVSAQVRTAIFEFIDRHLRPGGVAYLHYAAHPGAATLSAVHKVLHLAAKAHGSTRDRLQPGLTLLGDMREGAGLFAAHPRAAVSFDALLREPEGSVAHELGSDHWTPLHSSDIIASMDRIGCSYAGSAMPVQNIDALSLPGSTLAAIRAANSTVLAETLKDIARDEAMRQDLFVRSREPLAINEHFAALRALEFTAMPGAPRAGPLTFQTRIGPVEGAASVFSPLLGRLAGGPTSFAELEALAEFRNRPSLLNQSLALLMTSGLAHPTQAFNRSACKACERLNEVLQQRILGGAAVPAFANAFIGGPVQA